MLSGSPATRAVGYPLDRVDRRPFFLLSAGGEAGRGLLAVERPPQASAPFSSLSPVAGVEAGRGLLAVERDD